jgi:prophage regulatory protein
MTTKILRLPKVIERTGLSRSTIYQSIQDGKFPEAVCLGPRAVGWVEEDIEAWLQSRRKASRIVTAGGCHDSHK